MKNQAGEQDRAWLLNEKYGGAESDLSAEQAEAFHIDCERLAKGKPLGYVIGYVPFLDCQIWLDSHPLIPRPETEYWVEHVIDEISLSLSKRRGLTPMVLDLCAGSGAIGVAVAKAVSEAHVTFAEIDEAHLPTIEKNIESNLSVNRKVKDERFSIVQSDLFNGLSEVQETERVDGVRGVENFLKEPYEKYGDEKNGSHNKEIHEPFHLFDFILTNPPYIDAKAGTVEDSVTKHEPHIALFGGEAGMEVIAKIVTGARAKLAPHGQLWIEHEPFQSEAIAKLAKKHKFTITTHNDQYRTPRFSTLKPR